MKSHVFGYLLLFLVHSNFVLRDVDAGGQAYISCSDMSIFFNMSLDAYNSTINIYAQEWINILQTHASVNGSQASYDFNSYVDDVSSVYTNKIITATYNFFDTLAAFIGGVTNDDLVKIIFGETHPEYPLSCVENIYDPSYAFTKIGTKVNDLISAIRK